MLKKAMRYGGVVLICVAVLMLLIWVALLAYVNFNEEKIRFKVANAISERTRGEVKIGGVSVGFFRTFPAVSLQLEDVLVRDSLYHLHKKDLLTASDVYLRVSIPGLLSRRNKIGKIIVLNGIINLITDTSGNNNQYVLKPGGGEKRGSLRFVMPDVELKNVKLNHENGARNKSHVAHFHRLVCRAKTLEGEVRFKGHVKMLVNRLSFNTKKGVYLRDKLVSGQIDVNFYPDSKNIVLNKVRLEIDGHPFYFTGNFNTDKLKSDFKLTIRSNNVRYEKATAILTSALQKKLNRYTISKPIDLEVNLTGKTSSEKDPLIDVAINVKNSNIRSPYGTFEHCTFTGSYTNQLEKNRGRTDENSIIRLGGFTGNWEKIPIRSDSIRLINLIRPVLSCDLKSDFNIELLNRLTGSESFQFIRGNAKLDVIFEGSLLKGDSTPTKINGEVRIGKASIKYLPRNFLLSECDGTLKFNDNDLNVSDFKAKAGSTELSMKGAASNFLSIINQSPEKFVLNWNITSPKIDLQDFKSFIAGSKTKHSEKVEATFGKAASKVDRMFAEGVMQINLKTPEMIYKTFSASDVTANVLLKPSEISFQTVQLKHAGGSMDINGSLKNGSDINNVYLHTVMRDINIPQMFKAFRNFGQDAVTYENLRGIISADIQFRTAIDDKAELKSSANNGYINFVIQNGELNNFDPLIQISRKAFKKQNFAQVKFADLANRLDVKGTAFIINPMDIRSTALNFSVEGVYDFKKGTDMSIKFPLNNLTRSQANTDISDFGRAKKGIGLRLRAKTGDDGKLDISWDPFRRSIKNKSDVEDSSQAEK